MRRAGANSTGCFVAEEFVVIFVAFPIAFAERNSMRDGKTQCRVVGLCDLPPIEQKTLDGWGTRRLALKFGTAIP